MHDLRPDFLAHLLEVEVGDGPADMLPTLEDLAAGALHLQGDLHHRPTGIAAQRFDELGRNEL